MDRDSMQCSRSKLQENLAPLPSSQVSSFPNLISQISVRRDELCIEVGP
jgi:hypothetical protein